MKFEILTTVSGYILRKLEYFTKIIHNENNPSNTTSVYIYYMSYHNLNFEKNKIYSKLAKFSNCPFFTDFIFAQIWQRNPDIQFCTSTLCSTFADTKTLEEEDNGLLRLSDPDSIEVESTYRGVHLTFPLTQSQLQSLIKSFKTKQVLTFICTSHHPSD